MRKSDYQPTKDQQLADAQEVIYAKEFKKADIAGGYRAKKEQDPNK
ncbi:MAG TPA: YfhE family protein [Virgibacillus sp.]|nr:YfhE family protein [Virgibacillus sp.]